MKSNYQIIITLLIIFCMGSQIPAYGQSSPSASVLGAAGEISKTNGMIIEWTLGETFIASAKNSSTWHTQGYHQPVLIVRPDSKAPSLHKVNIYPNPAEDVLNVTVRTSSLDPMILKMIDVTGRIVLLQDAPGGPQDVQLRINHLPEGMYMLSVVSRNGSWIKSFKVIKH